jgi:hypothetical protein
MGTVGRHVDSVSECYSASNPVKFIACAAEKARLNRGGYESVLKAALAFFVRHRTMLNWYCATGRSCTVVYPVHRGDQHEWPRIFVGLVSDLG